jgi:4'-phosphopantetheinyl transferase
MSAPSESRAGLSAWHIPAALPGLHPGTIHIWRLLSEHHANPGRALALLRPDEQQRAAQFVFPQHRQEWIGSRAILRVLLAHYTSSASPQEIPIALGTRGKPSLHRHPLRFNLSHTPGVALFAFACGFEVGVDVEHIAPSEDLTAVAEQNFSAAEREALKSLPQDEQLIAFYRCWTRKEALLKAEGSGLFHALDTFSVSLRPDEPAQVLGGVEGWALAHLDILPDAIGALAWEKQDSPPAIHLLDWSPSLFPLP